MGKKARKTRWRALAIDTGEFFDVFINCGGLVRCRIFF